MSLVFNDTATKKGLVQRFEKAIGAKYGTISGNQEKLMDFAARVNLALDDFWNLAIPASGTWQLDDSNHEDYPIIYRDIVSGRREYAFTEDEEANLILDIYKVAILPSATATLYQEIYPFDELEYESDIVTETTTGSIPYQYGKLANGIFLEGQPNYDATEGLKIYINREASYFTHEDTTKKPGVAGTLHAYFYLKPALEYAGEFPIKNAKKLQESVLAMEKAIVDVYSRREKDVIDRTIPEPIIYE